MLGKAVKNRIEEKTLGAKASIDDAYKKLHDAQQKILSLQNNKVKLYQQIARIFLLESPKTTNKQIQILVDELQEVFCHLNKRTDELEQISVNYQQKVNSLQEQLDEKITRKIFQLENNPDYVSLFTIFKKAEERLNKESKNYQLSLDEFTQKIEEYKQNRCYNYLIERNFGKDNYKGFWIFRHLDAWVARFINFAENHKNQKTLEALIKESQQRYETIKTAHRLASEKKEKIEHDIEESLGLPQLRNDLNQTNLILENYKKQKSLTDKTLNDSLSGHSKQFNEISSKLAKLLQQQSINEVVQLTLQSNSLEDDKLIQQIPILDRKIQQVEQSLPTLKHTVEALEYTYMRFEQTLSIFIQNDIPSSYYEYNISSSKLDELLNNLLNKDIFPETIVHVLISCRSQANSNKTINWSSSNSTSMFSTTSSTKQTSWNSSSRSSSTSSSSSSKASGSSSGGSGFSSSSSTGGGGFKTTDSF